MLRIALIALGLIWWVMPSESFAQTQGGARAGLIYGYSVPDADDTKARRLWGVLGSTMLGGSFSVGGYYLVTDKVEGTGSRYFNYSIHGLSFEYGSGQGKGRSFYGLRLGLTKLEVPDGTGGNVVLSPYHWGFVAGYDYNLFSWSTIGFEGSFLQFDDSASGTVTEDPFNTISFSVTTKILF